MYNTNNFIPCVCYCLCDFMGIETKIGSCQQHRVFIFLRWVCLWIVFNYEIILKHTRTFCLTWIIFLLIKRKLIRFDWTLNVTWIKDRTFCPLTAHVSGTWSSVLALVPNNFFMVPNYGIRLSSNNIFSCLFLLL